MLLEHFTWLQIYFCESWTYRILFSVATLNGRNNSIRCNRWEFKNTCVWSKCSINHDSRSHHPISIIGFRLLSFVVAQWHMFQNKTIIMPHHVAAIRTYSIQALDFSHIVIVCMWTGISISGVYNADLVPNGNDSYFLIYQIK